MTSLEILNAKQILAVDDEPDVLEIIKDALPQCDVTVASDFGSALKLIRSLNFDLIILDIMGVNGFDLLEESRKQNIPATMLTAHAVNVESLNKSLHLGAVSFLPKEELANLPELLAEIFESLAEGETHWQKLFKRTGSYFKERLGITWEDLDNMRPPHSY